MRGQTKACKHKNESFPTTYFIFWWVLPFTLAVKNRPKHRISPLMVDSICKHAPLPPKIPPSTQPDSWAPQRQASQHHAALPRGQGHSDRTCGRSETFTLAREPFPPIVGDGFTLLPTPNISFNHNRVWIWSVKILAGYLKPSLSCWDSLN